MAIIMIHSIIIMHIKDVKLIMKEKSLRHTVTDICQAFCNNNFRKIEK